MNSAAMTSSAALAKLLLALLAGTTTQAREPIAAYPDPPQALFQELFVAVQTARIFPDGKEFADALPNAPPARILAQYRAHPPASPEALKIFVDGALFDAAADRPGPRRA